MKKIKPKISESQLVSASLDLLRQLKFLAWRNQSGALLVNKKLIRLAPAGSPDIMFIAPPKGQLFGLELKVGRNTVTPMQKAFGSAMEAKGAIYAVIRSLDELIDLLNKHKLI